MSGPKVPTDPAMTGEVRSFLEDLTDQVNNDVFQVANNLSEGTPATIRTNISAAAKSQAFDWCGVVGDNRNATWHVVPYASYAGTITQLATRLTSGSLTLTIDINGTPVTGGSIASDATARTSACTAANTFVAGDAVNLVSTGNSGALGPFFVIKYTRTLD